MNSFILLLMIFYLLVFILLRKVGNFNSCVMIEWVKTGSEPLSLSVPLVDQGFCRISMFICWLPGVSSHINTKHHSGQMSKLKEKIKQSCWIGFNWTKMWASPWAAMGWSSQVRRDEQEGELAEELSACQYIIRGIFSCCHCAPQRPSL